MFHLCCSHLAALHALERLHDVVGGLEELSDAVVELLLLVRGELGLSVSLLKGLLTAQREHAREHVGVALHRDSLHVSVHLDSQFMA